MLLTCWGLWLGALVCLTQTLDAQTAPKLSIHVYPGYAGITVTDTVSNFYTIEATTNLALMNGWVALTNVVLPTSPWVYIDYASPGMAKRFYRAVGVITNSPLDTNAPAGMVFIPAGTFTMGSPSTEQGRDSDEGPQTQATITQGFWMNKYETTQEEYQTVMGNNPSYFTGDLKCPMEQVTWYDATNYCGKLTAQERAAGRLPAGYEYRLPTEAEWEYACRAGTTTRRVLNVCPLIPFAQAGELGAIRLTLEYLDGRPMDLISLTVGQAPKPDETQDQFF